MNVTPFTQTDSDETDVEFVVKNVPFAAGSEVRVNERYMIVMDKEDSEKLELVRAWNLLVDMVDEENYFHVQINSMSGEILQLNGIVF